MRTSDSPVTPVARTRYRCRACNEEAPFYNLPVFWRWLAAAGALFGSLALWEMFS